MDKAIESSIDPLDNVLISQIQALNNKDQTNDLDLYLEESTPLQYSSENEQAFIKQPTIPFPELLKSFLQQPALGCQIGSLTSIQHIWLSTKTSLFLWNIANKDAELFRYDCGELIANVQVIDLPTHKELLISTQNNIYLHAISLEDPKKLKLVSRNSIRSYGVVMSNVVTSNTGRVFMKGDDGHVYELELEFDAQQNITSCSLNCRTSNRLLQYLPSVLFRSRPTEQVRAIVLDDDAKFLFLLLSDASICAVNIQGDQYVPYHRYAGKALESLHLVSSDRDKSRIMAIANNGDRLFFVLEASGIHYQYTRPAPPVPGSLLYNKMSKESVSVSFYSEGVVGNVLEKAERSYLVFTSADMILKENGRHQLVEDVYQELVHEKIWHIFENKLEKRVFTSALKSPKCTRHPIFVMTESGITQYIKQRPVDYLESALFSRSSSSLINVINRYGSLETTYLAYLLACSRQDNSQQVHDFIQQSVNKEDGLLLLFTRYVSSIWNMKLKQESVSNDVLVSVQNDLIVLQNTVNHDRIRVGAEVMTLVARTIQAISFICFMRTLDWNQIVQAWSAPEELTFAELATTERGLLLAQEMVFIGIKHSAGSDITQQYSYIGNYLNDHCLALFGTDVITYFKGVECLRTASKLKEDERNEALCISLQHFLKTVTLIDLPRITEISQANCDLGNYENALVLTFAKSASGTATFEDVHSIFFSILTQALEDKTIDGRSVVMTALKIGHSDTYHFSIYKWLYENDYKDLLITLDALTLIPYIETQLPSRAESLACLEKYYTHREQFGLSIKYLYALATDTEGLNLEMRMRCLKKALGYMDKAKDLEAATADAVRRSSAVAHIQKEMHDALVANGSTEAADRLNGGLFDEHVLLEQYAYTHALYEEALLLLDLMDIYNWTYVKEAWNRIVQAASKETDVCEKVKGLANRLYPSIPSFPVYIIYQILHGQFNNDVAESILVKSGVPREVVSDAKKTV